MRSRDADIGFRAALRREGIDLDETMPRTGFDALLGFYRRERADDATLEDDGDMLLFQWGTYDWGEGRHFELNLTRQLIVEPGGDDNIWQLSLTYRYEPTDDLEELGSGDEWCHHPSFTDEFVELVFGSDQFAAAGDLPPAEVVLSFDVVG